MREVCLSCQELSGDAQYAIVQPEKVFSGGRHPSSEDDGPGRKALCVALGGYFCRRRLWSAMVVVVVVDQ